MKKILLPILFLFIFSFSEAAKWRVNNSPGIDADFLGLQEAHDAAGEGDTIYVEGSLTVYDNNNAVNISKQLVIIGPGYFLGENPFTQANKMTANFNRINFIAGAEGSIMMGLVIYRVDLNVLDITVRRNNVTNGLILNSENFIVAQNTIYDIDGRNCKGLISNNIIRYARFDANSFVSVFNNVFYLLNNSISSLDIYNSEIRNNIINSYTDNALFLTSRNNTITNNIFRQNGTEANGNKFNLAFTAIFVEGGTTDGTYKLAENSPAKGAGLNGIDCGPFGGPLPYVLSGIPPGPSIYEVSAPATASKTEGLPVNIKIHSHL
ncbi:right-handed parallel beta-helix repeat-containing protein [Lunatibacter salilacus]|uniref:hypothetical protein n=1 Tax=Lunatibacter salilacus TaxID=2483804 RepID=UPI00131BCE30|nr:hypothetical protein [Lunatibacter salilacus]